MILNEVGINQLVKVKKIHNDPVIRRRLFDLGIMKDAKIMLVLKSPSKNMKAYRVKDTTIALRNHESKMIEVSSIEE